MSENETVETATETTTEVDEAVETQSESTDTADEAALGDPGKKALDAMKAREKKARADARAAIERAEAAEAALANKDKPVEEQALDAARAEERKAAMDKANARILRADLRAAATGKLADPADAALYIDLSEFTVTDDGETDSDALIEAITDLIERKPHLAAAKPNRFDGDADQGAKGKESRPSQLTRAELADMTAEEIVEAQNAGRLKDLGY